MLAQLRTVLIVLVLAVVMIALGRLLGGLTAPEGPISENEVERLIRNLDEPVEKRIDSHKSRAVAGLLVPLSEQVHWPTVLDELSLARQHGVTSFIFQTGVPWQEEKWAALERLNEALSIVAGARVWLALDLNPDPLWLDEHPDDVSTFSAEGVAYPSIGSTEWRNAGSAALLKAGRELEETMPDLPVAGVILRGLEDGQWFRTVGYDGSPANTAGFQEWLKRRYESVDALNESWQVEVSSFAELRPPEPPVESKGVFFAAPEDQPLIDYMDYLNATTANALSFFADCARQAFGEHTAVFAAYGSVFDFGSPEHGQWGLSEVLSGGVDGLALNVHRADRSLGDVGGPSGPHTVPGLHNKRWLLLDDTRTGIGWNATTNGIFKPAGFEMRTLAPMYDRNLLSAAMERGAVFWSDARGQGNFMDNSLWEYFVSRVPAIDELQFAPLNTSRTVLVVLDERSMRYVADGERITDLVNATRRAAQQSGVSYAYVLLEDLLSGRAPEARVFVFPNLFHLDRGVRTQLHDYLAEHGAAAVWIYAPGVLNSGDAAQSVSEVVQMTVYAYEEPVPAMSAFTLSGIWVEEGDKFGGDGLWKPLFYIADDASDPLAKYAGSEDSSVAVKFMEEGWASVFIATPAITPSLFKEILDILDHPPVVRNSGPTRSQSFSIRDGYLLLHAEDSGDRLLDFRERQNVSDVLDPEVGWPDKQTLQITLRDGETRLLKLTPAPRTQESTDVSFENSVLEAPADPVPASSEEVSQRP